MGYRPPLRSIRLPAKLAQIRAKLGMTQSELSEELSDNRWILSKGHISRFESGEREPAPLILLRYARLAKVTMEMLVDDEMDLPKKFS